MNTTPCKDCLHFDQQYKYTHAIDTRTRTKTLQTVPLRHGFCVAQSTYPAQEQDGQIFPPEAKRVAPGELPKPVPVDAKGVVRNCHHVMAKNG